MIWAMVGLAFLLRFLWCWNKSLWMDEAAAVYVAQYPLMDILLTTPETFFHPPFYLAILNLDISLFGNSRLVWALPTVIMGSFSVWLLYDVVRRLEGRATGICVGFAAVFSPFLVFLSQEVFDYTALLFASLLAWDLLIMCLEQSRKYWLWIFWGLVLVVGLYTHLFMSLVIITQFITFLFWKDKGRGAWWGIIIAGFVAIGLYLPFVFRAVSMVVRMSGEIRDWGISPGLVDIAKKGLGVFYYQLCGYYFSNLDWNGLSQVASNPLSLFLFLTLIFFPVSIIIWSLTGWKKLAKRTQVVFLPMFFIPLSLVIASGINARQFVTMSPALIFLLGYGIKQIYGTFRKYKILVIFLLGGLLLTWSWTIVNYYRLEVNPVRQENWRDAFAIIEKYEQPGDIIYNHSSLAGEVEQRIYYHGNLPRVNSNIDANSTKGEEVTGVRGILIHIDLWINELLKNNKRVWFIYASFPTEDFDEMIARAKAEHPDYEWDIGRDLRLILFER